MAHLYSIKLNSWKNCVLINRFKSGLCSCIGKQLRILIKSLRPFSIKIVWLAVCLQIVWNLIRSKTAYRHNSIAKLHSMIKLKQFAIRLWEYWASMRFKNRHHRLTGWPKLWHLTKFLKCAEVFRIPNIEQLPIHIVFWNRWLKRTSKLKHLIWCHLLKISTTNSIVPMLDFLLDKQKKSQNNNVCHKSTMMELCQNIIATLMKPMSK